MALSPKIKRTLVGVAVAYVLFVPVFVYFASKAKIEATEKKYQQVAKEVTALFKKHGRVLPPRDAKDLVDRYFAGKGAVFGANATLVMQILNFAVLLILLYALLWEPMIQFLDQRREAIRQEIESARQSNQQAQERLAEYEKKLADARAERQKMVEDGRREGRRVRDEIIAEARQQAERMLQKAREETAAEAARARDELRQEIGALSVSVAEKILEREVNEADHERLIETLIKSLESADPAEMKV